MKKFPTNLFDKNNIQIKEDDVVYNGEHYFRIYWNEMFSQVEAISPTYGYLHDLTPEILVKFECMGSFDKVANIYFDFEA